MTNKSNIGQVRIPPLDLVDSSFNFPRGEEQVIFSVRKEFMGELLESKDGIIADKLTIKAILDRLVEKAEVHPRKELENNFSYIHPIHYCPIIDKDGNIFLYQRSKGIGEERLLGKHSIGIGGHIDYLIENYQELERKHYEEPEKVLDYLKEVILQDGMWREFTEEIKDLPIINSSRFSFAFENRSWIDGHPFMLGLCEAIEGQLNEESNVDFIIYDTSNEVGKVHLGLVTIVPFIDDFIPNGFTIEMAEEFLVTKGFRPIEEINKTPNVENWTKLILSAIETQFRLKGKENYIEEIFNRVKESLEVKANYRLGSYDQSTGTYVNIDIYGSTDLE